MALIFISGASSGIGLALARSAPWPRSRVIDISRRGAPGLEHFAADLAEPEQWERVAALFARELRGLRGRARGLRPRRGHARADRICRRGRRRGLPARRAARRRLPAGAGRRLPARRAHDASAVPPRPDQLGRRAQRLRRLVGLRRGQGGDRSMGAHGRRRAGAPRRSRARARRRAGDRGDARCRSRSARRRPRDFPEVARFVELHEQHELRDPGAVAVEIWALLARDLPNGAVVDLRDLEASATVPGAEDR